jgi:hypothetical protein
MNELSEYSRALLSAAQAGDEPTDGDRVRVQRALSASIAAGTTLAAPAAAAATGGTSAVAGGVGVAKIAAWMGVGLIAGLVSGGAVIAVQELREPSRSAAPPAAAPRPAHVVAIAAAPAAPAPDDEPVPTVEAPRATPAPSARIAARATTPVVGSIAAETALLEAARTALGRGDARAALDDLNEHEKRFPEGTLTEERLASKVFALCALGRKAEASDAAAALLRRAPSSPLRARVLDSCAAPP